MYYQDQLDNISKEIQSTLNDFIHKEKLKPNIHIKKSSLEKIEQIIITGKGCGYNIATVGAYNIELLTHIPTIAISSTELMATRGVLNKSTLVISICLDAENETLFATRRAKQNGSKIIILSTSNAKLFELSKNIITLDEENHLCFFQQGYFALCMLGLYLGSKIGYTPKLHISVCLKLAEMMMGKVTISSYGKAQLKSAGEYISNFKTIIPCGYGADVGVAEEISRIIRSDFEIASFSMPIDQITQCEGQENTLILPIISNNSHISTINIYLQNIKNCGLPTLIFTTEGYAIQLDIKDGIVNCSDSLPLFNPIGIITTLQQSISSNLDFQSLTTI